MREEFLNHEGMEELWRSTKNLFNRSSLINIPVGAVIAWAGTEDEVPNGWHICDGEDGTIDLRDKFILGSGPNHPIGEEGGAEEITLETTQIPAHSHNLPTKTTGVTRAVPMTYLDLTGTTTIGFVRTSDGVEYSNWSGIIQNAGNSRPHPNMPPYYSLLFIQKMSMGMSEYMTREEVLTEIRAVLTTAGSPVGSIMMWSGTADDIPDGWHICNGEDGTVDLRDKFILGAGPKHPIGEEGGEDKVTLTESQMPSHSHYLNARGQSGTTASTSRPNLVASGDSNSWFSQMRDSQYYQLGVLSSIGESEPHPNMPPYYSLLFIQKIA